MKGLKKIALATAVAAAPFTSHAELKALDDSAMGNVTGQAGVTIELETKVSIGQFKYTDEGSFAVNDIVLGGSGVAGGTGGELLDQLKIDIDVADDGDAVIHVGSLETHDVQVRNPLYDGDPGQDNGTVDEYNTIEDAPKAIDWGMTAGSIELLPGGTGTDSTTLISGLSAHGNLARLDMRVDTADDALNMDVAFDIQDMDFQVDFLAIGIEDMQITGAGMDFDYDGDGLSAGQEARFAALLEGGLVTPDPTTGEVTDPDTGVTTDAANVADGVEGETDQIEIGKLTNYANAKLKVYAGDHLGAAAGGSGPDVLRIDVSNIYMDVKIGKTLIGGTNIGEIAINNLAVTDTKMAVYGH